MHNSLKVPFIKSQVNVSNVELNQIPLEDTSNSRQQIFKIFIGV